MKTLRVKVLLASVATILAFVTVLQTACKKDETTEPYVDTECIDVNCNNGECNKGQCGCYPGWEGFYCDIKSVNRYLGTWNAKETVTVSNDTSTIGDTMLYNFYILPYDADITKFKLAGLMNHPNDTILVSLGVPQNNEYMPNAFRFRSYASTSVPDLYMPGGGGKMYSSSVMDSMSYIRWYGLPGNDSFVLKETVQIDAQKAP